MNELMILPTESEMKQIKDIAGLAVKSGLLPEAINTPEKAAIIILKGKELGLPPMVAFSHINVIKGKPTMSGEIMLAYIRKDFPKAVITFKKSDDKECILECARSKDEPTQTISMSFQQAMDAGFAKQWDKEKKEWVVKDNWKKQPKTMLRWRCVSEMKRFVFPEVLLGIDYTPEELEDVQDEPKTIKVESVVVDTKPIETKAGTFETKAKPETTEYKLEDAPKPDPQSASFAERGELMMKVADQRKRLKWNAETTMKFVEDNFGKKSPELTNDEMKLLIQTMEKLGA